MRRPVEKETAALIKGKNKNIIRIMHVQLKQQVLRG